MSVQALEQLSCFWLQGIFDHPQAQTSPEIYLCSFFVRIYLAKACQEAGTPNIFSLGATETARDFAPWIQDTSAEMEEMPLTLVSQENAK